MIRHRRFYTPINWFLTFAGIFSWPKRKKLQKRLALSVCEANLHILMNQEMEMYCFIISHSNAKSPLDLYQLEPWAWLGLKYSPLQKFFPPCFGLISEKRSLLTAFDNIISWTWNYKTASTRRILHIQEHGRDLLCL